jgi:hypothetical protein
MSANLSTYFSRKNQAPIIYKGQKNRSNDEDSNRRPTNWYARLYRFTTASCEDHVGEVRGCVKLMVTGTMTFDYSSLLCHVLTDISAVLFF